MDKLLPCPFCGGKAKIKGKKIKRVTCGCTARVYGQTRETAIAAWNRRADARQLALKTRVCPMCEDCPDGCPVETPKDSRNIVTNADRIRSMTDGELAQILVSEPIAETIPFCQNKPECERLLETANGTPESMCVECALDWLQQPVEVVNSD